MAGKPAFSLPPAFRLPLLFLGMLALVTGVLGGLTRLGWPAPPPVAAAAGWHGALMISAFFGTVISLERAVALGHPWTYLAPAMAGAGGVTLLAGAPAGLAQVLLAGAAAVLLIASIGVLRRQPAAFTAVLALGALSWLLGNIFWVLEDSTTAIPGWLAFLVLTIAGERLELTRFLPTRPAAKGVFLSIAAALILGMVGSLWHESAGLMLFSTSLLALAAWLARYDIARRNIREAGLTRFIAICLLSGYGWLAVGAILGMAGGLAPGHPWRDPALHALTLGFVFSMVLGHAPIIFPAVARIRIPFHPVMFLPLVVLHLSLGARIVGGLAGDFGGQRYGGLGNAIALLLFIGTMAASALRARFGRPGPG